MERSKALMAILLFSAAAITVSDGAQRFSSFHEALLESEADAERSFGPPTVASDPVFGPTIPVSEPTLGPRSP